MAIDVTKAEQLSKSQQTAIQANLPKAGELFLLDIGEGGRALATINNGNVVRLGFDFPQDWQGKTIGQWQNEFTRDYASQLGVDLNSLKQPNVADLNQFYGQGGKLTNVNQFKGLYSNVYGGATQEVPTGNVQTEGGTVSAAGLQNTSQSGLQEGKAYKFPNDPKVYRVENGQLVHIPDEQTFRGMYGGLPELGTNVTELQGTIADYQSGGTTPSSTPSGGINIPDTGNPLLNETLKTLNDYLAELQSRGEVLNPEIEITPEKAAEFLAQAQSEINPYYASQLGLARENLLRNAGYTTDSIAQFESQLGKQYGLAQRQIGESAADRGFAQSGIRKQEETQLAEDVQNRIDTNRRDLQFQLGSSARQFAQQFGGTEGFQTPSLSIASAPRVTGQGTLEQSGQTPFVDLSDSVYDDIIGEQEYNRRGAVRSRSSELEGAFRTNQAIDQQRQLIL
ncbi:hypothetical protein M0R04_10705 [Candidatus Dojkabacteria bacterium]|jgi:hypothetical protein|nr:hypothetical protein [Candidatus Dojkabacteria bacterium]